MVTNLAHRWSKVCGPYASILLNEATLFKLVYESLYSRTIILKIRLDYVLKI
jgi:hypothetical protein